VLLKLLKLHQCNYFKYNIFNTHVFHQTFNYQVLVYFVRYLQTFLFHLYRGADKSLARPTSRCILFGGENISFDASLLYIYIYIYIYITNIPPIIIINRIYENQNLLSM
jgi:hypothetical protein